MAIAGNGPSPVGGGWTEAPSGTPSKLGTRAGSDAVGQKSVPSVGVHGCPKGAGGAAGAAGGARTGGGGAAARAGRGRAGGARTRGGAAALSAARSRDRMAAERTPRPCGSSYGSDAIGGLGLDRGGLGALAGDRVLELAHAAAERATELGQLLRADHDERDDEDDDEFHGADRRHVSLLVQCRTPRDGRGGVNDE